MQSSNPSLVMEFDSSGVKDEKQVNDLDRLQRIHSIFPKPPPVFIRSESSLSFDQAKMNRIDMLASSPNDKKQRYVSASRVHDPMKTRVPVFTRLNKPYKSTKLPKKIYRKTTSITEITDTTRSEHAEEIDVGKAPPTDDSLFFDNLESIRNIEIDGVKIFEVIRKGMGSEEMKIFSEMENGNVPERNGILFSDFDDNFRNRALTWACMRGLTHLLPSLEASGTDINNLAFFNATPVMYAAFSGEVACLKYLIERGADFHYVSPLYKHGALHSAAAGNRPETAEILLDNGADLNNELNKVDMIPLLHYAIKIKSESVAELFIKRGANTTFKNLIGETPLHVACSAQSLKCCELLLQKPEVDINAVDEMNRSPLHYAVMATDSNIKLVELLLKHGALVNLIDNTGFSPLHVAALKEKSECVEMLIRYGADVSAITGKGVSALHIILRKIPESFQAFRIKMDSSLRLKRLGCQSRELEMRFDFNSILPSDEKPETSLINIFLEENLTDLLSHPLVKAFLQLKWKRIRKFYIFNIFCYTLMVIFMSTYVLTALAYKCYNSYEENNANFNETNAICYYFGKQVVEFEWYIWLVLVCFMIPKKILSFAMYKNFQEYLWNTENALDTINILSVFATSFVYTGRTYTWQNYVGATSVLCAWTNLMLMIGQLPGYGTYVAMFTHIQYEFAKLLFAYSGLLIGFTLSFCVIFHAEPSFANILTGLIKILTMMVGELDFEGLINHPKWSKNGYIVVYRTFSVFSQFLFSLFVIIIVVILMNLLVGIAVHDIKGLRNQADLTKLVRATKLIVYTEMAECKLKLLPFLKCLSSKKANFQIRKHILLVKPLSPMEKSLPTGILKAAYEIAQKNNPVLDDEYPDCRESFSYIPQKKGNIETTLDTAVEQLNTQFKINNNQIHEIKDQLHENQKILEEIMLKLS